VVRFVEQVYADLPSWKIWPLFKLNRLDEAGRRSTLPSCPADGRLSSTTTAH
jgi:hypothetical protein